MKITLLAGRAHLKHTEGGRFPPGHLPGGAPGPDEGRERFAGARGMPSGWRCLRRMVGRAMSDLQRMSGQLDPPQTEGELSHPAPAAAPVADHAGVWPWQVAAYTRAGRGRLFLHFDRAMSPATTRQQVIAAIRVRLPSGTRTTPAGFGVLCPWGRLCGQMGPGAPVYACRQRPCAWTRPKKRRRQPPLRRRLSATAVHWKRTKS